MHDGYNTDLLSPPHENHRRQEPPSEPSLARGAWLFAAILPVPQRPPGGSLDRRGPDRLGRVLRAGNRGACQPDDPGAGHPAPGPGPRPSGTRGHLAFRLQPPARPRPERHADPSAVRARHCAVGHCRQGGRTAAPPLVGRPFPRAHPGLWLWHDAAPGARSGRRLRRRGGGDQGYGLHRHQDEGGAGPARRRQAGPSGAAGHRCADALHGRCQSCL